MHRRGIAFVAAVAISLAMIACPSKPPESAANVSPPTQASTSTSPSTSTASKPPAPPSDEQQLQGAVYTYCSAYEECTHQSNTPCMTMILQYMETGCTKQMLRYYECADASTCGDGGLVTPEACNDAYDAMDDCMSGKKK